MNCERCGVLEDTKALQKYLARTGKVLCESCRATRRNRLRYPDGSICLPWHGSFDDDDNPLDDLGNLFLAGVRSCNHKDCCEPSHVIGLEVPVGKKRGRPVKFVDLDEAIVKKMKEQNG